MKEWVVVVANSEAKIFEKNGDELSWLKNIENAEGKSHERDFFMDRPGLNFPRPRAIHGGPYGLKTHDPHKHIVRDRFALKIVRILENEFSRKKFNQLTILADPHLVGVMRAALKGNLKKLNPRFLTKDLVHATTETLKQTLLASI